MTWLTEKLREWTSVFFKAKKTNKTKQKHNNNNNKKPAAARLGEKERGEKTKRLLIKLILSALNEEVILQERST